MSDIYDIVDETCGAASAQTEKPRDPDSPRQQISNLSRPKEKSQIRGACSNMVNSIVGAGIIGIPYALNESGLVAGVLLLILVSFFTDKSLRMLVELAHFHPKLKSIDVLTFEDLMSLPFGKNGKHFIMASMLIVAYGAMVAYLLIIKDTVPIVMGFDHGGGGENEENEEGQSFFAERELIMLVTSLVVIVPLSMQRDMSTLAFTSALSVMADIILVFIVTFFAPVKESVENAGGIEQVIQNSVVNYGFFIGFGVLTTAMTCQHSAFIVSGSLNNLTSKRWGIVTLLSMTTACILCAMLGIAGYLGFLEETQGDVLNNFDADAIEGTVARMLLAFTMFFTYPMEALVARHVLIQLIYDGDVDGDQTERKGMTSWFHCNRRVSWTLIIYLATLIPALIVDDLGPVLSITGALGGCCLAYIGPGLAYLGINGDSFLDFVLSTLKNYQGYYNNESTYIGMEDDSPDFVVDDVIVWAGPKPWWWYPLFMPVWVKIATNGYDSLKKRLEMIEIEQGPAMLDDEIETILPVKEDYYISIFFVVFGLLACIAGLVSNFWVQVM